MPASSTGDVADNATHFPSSRRNEYVSAAGGTLGLCRRASAFLTCGSTHSEPAAGDGDDCAAADCCTTSIATRASSTRRMLAMAQWLPGLALPRDSAACASSLTIRSTSFVGTGSSSGNRIVPVLISYDSRSVLSAARTAPVTG